MNARDIALVCEEVAEAERERDWKQHHEASLAQVHCSGFVDMATCADFVRELEMLAISADHFREFAQEQGYDQWWLFMELASDAMNLVHAVRGTGPFDGKPLVRVEDVK